MLVEPDASAVAKAVVSRPNGRLLMKGEMSTADTLRPSSAPPAYVSCAVHMLCLYNLSLSQALPNCDSNLGHA